MITFEWTKERPAIVAGQRNQVCKQWPFTFERQNIFVGALFRDEREDQFAKPLPGNKHTAAHFASTQEDERHSDNLSYFNLLSFELSYNLDLRQRFQFPYER